MLMLGLANIPRTVPPALTTYRLMWLWGGNSSDPLSLPRPILIKSAWSKYDAMSQRYEQSKSREKILPALGSFGGTYVRASSSASPSDLTCAFVSVTMTGMLRHWRTGTLTNPPCRTLYQAVKHPAFPHSV